jgi:CelD/BcsL family acetyltransferase involved in cellulose biosynthesis
MRPQRQQESVSNITTEALGQITNYRDTHKDSIKVQVYQDFAQLENLRSEWDEFLKEIEGEIFLTYDWCRIWWKYYRANRQLAIFVFRHNSKLVGLIPMFFEKICLGPINIGVGKLMSTDFTISTISLPISKESLPAVIKKFFRIIKTNYAFDILHLGPMAGLYQDFDRLLELCREYSPTDYRQISVNDNVQTYFMMADSWQHQMQQLSKKQRRITKQKDKALRKVVGKDTPIVCSFASDKNSSEIFNRFYELHQKRWEKIGKPGHFGDWPDSKQFHREMVQEQQKHDRLRLLEVTSGDYLLGHKYAYRFGNQYMEFLDSRTDNPKLARASVGRIIFCEQLKKALQENVKYIDSLRGRYEHKLRMGGELLPINNIYLYSIRKRAKVKIWLFRKLAQILNICYYKIWYMRVAPKLPLKRRPLWKIWIRTHMFAYSF